MERRFDEELKQLKERLLTMAAMAEESVGKSIKALVDRNAQLAESVLQEDAVINRLDHAVDRIRRKGGEDHDRAIGSRSLGGDVRRRRKRRRRRIDHRHSLGRRRGVAAGVGCGPRDGRDAPGE